MQVERRGKEQAQADVAALQQAQHAKQVLHEEELATLQRVQQEELRKQSLRVEALEKQLDVAVSAHKVMPTVASTEY